jgi:DNA-binding beta-propeller fold protein YncE
MKALRPFFFIFIFISMVSLACSVGGSSSGSPSGTDTSGTQSSGGSSSSPSQELAFGSQGIGPGMFNDVRGLAVNPSTGAIVAADYHDGRIQAFDPTGKFLTQWTAPGGKSAIITGMTGDGSGNVYVVTGGKILDYDSTGKLKATLAPSGLYIDNLVVAADGNLVAAAEKETIVHLSPAGKVLSTIKNAFSANGADSPELDMRVAVDGIGNIYALGTFNNAVFKFSPDGKFVQRFGSEGDAQGKFSAPGSIAVDGSGRVYVGDFKGIQVFDGNGVYQSLIKVTGSVRSMTFDSQNNLYFSTQKDQIFKFSVPKS